MGVALLNGIAFRIDPSTVGWTYSVKAAEIKTVGGKVVQVYGVDLGDMTVTGSFGRGGLTEQEAFLTRMKAIADQQVRDAGKRNNNSQPSRFLYPTKGWDFLVYLKEFTQPESPANASVYIDPLVFAPKWSLTLFMVTDNVGLRKIAQDDYIARLSKGIGWKANSPYSGPVDASAVQQYLNGQSVEQAVGAAFGLSQSVPSGATGAGS